MKRVGLIALQLLVTGAGIWYVFHDPEKRAQVVAALRQADAGWLALGWICYSAVEVLATGRRPLLGTLLLKERDVCIQFTDGGLVTIDAL